MDEYEDEFEFDGPSKSAVKREMHALQALGTRLVGLPEAQLKTVPIEDQQLADAIALARRLKARSGLRRQLQFIGKLMRNIDPEPIEQALSRIDGKHQADNARFHRLEQLRDAALTQGDKGLEQVLAAFPNADRQHLRQLIRSHTAEQKNNKPPAAARKLFKYLRELDSEED